MFHRLALSALIAAIVVDVAVAQSSSGPVVDVTSQRARLVAAIGKWGLDLTSQDSSVKAGDDFFRHANGRWLATTEIPPDRTAWSAGAQLLQDAEIKVREIIQSQSASAPAGSVAQKVGDFYRAFLDTDAIERAGLAPAKPALEAIAAARSHADVARLMGRPDLGLRSPINLGVTIDEKNPDRYIVGVGQGGLVLPEREYYLSKEASFVELRQKYVAHIERMLGLAGENDGGAQAQSVVALETQIAEHHWPIAKRRERELTYNLRSRRQLEALAPSFPWVAILSAAKLEGEREFVVGEIDAVEALGKDFTQTPVATWRSYLKYHYLASVAHLLPKAFDDERFDFYGRTLSGQPQQRERWKRAVAAVNGALGEAVGQLYVERHFPPQSKAQMLALVENLRRAYAQRIGQLTWMSEPTKKVALEKLAAFRPKIGYPDKSRDYSALEVRAGDAFRNSLRAQLFERQRDLDRLSKPTDRDEWFMTPQIVNAYYNAVFNEIVFPAAILQPPYFDPHADAAINYGAIGAIIGHEMGHGFDDQGAKSDARGVLRTWWQPEDESAFKKLGDQLATQYSAYEALPGLKVNGRLTLGENIGDLGGLTVAYAAYRLSLNGREAPVLDGFSGDQRFFLSWAQAWCSLIRDETLRNLVMSDPHSPPYFRVNGALRNMDEWYEAFDVQRGDKLYLSPEQRVKIW